MKKNLAETTVKIHISDFVVIVARSFGYAQDDKRAAMLRMTVGEMPWGLAPADALRMTKQSGRDKKKG